MTVTAKQNELLWLVLGRDNCRKHGIRQKIPVCNSQQDSVFIHRLRIIVIEILHGG